jgi:hypothetical protein
VISNAEALVNVLDRINEREGARFPSRDVQLKALHLMEDDHVRQHVGQWRLYEVDGNSGTHLVAALLYPATPPSATVDDVKCSCKSTHVCSHMLAALAELERHGYHLQT